jgi:hypothetical protein
MRVVGGFQPKIETPVAGLAWVLPGCYTLEAYYNEQNENRILHTWHTETQQRQPHSHTDARSSENAYINDGRE